MIAMDWVWVFIWTLAALILCTAVVLLIGPHIGNGKGRHRKKRS